MPRRLLLSLSALGVVLFLSGGIVLSSTTLDELEVGGWRVPGRWKVSSPTVQRDTGEYLAYDVTGQSPRVYFTKKKGPHTTWAFVDREPYSHSGLTYEQGRRTWVSVEETGWTLRLRAAEGPFKGWCLSSTDKGDFVLVKKPDGAAKVVFRLKEVRSTGR